MPSSSAPNKSNTKGLASVSDPATSSVLAVVDNELADQACDDGLTPAVASDTGCSAVVSQVRTDGQGYIRHGNRVQVVTQVASPLTASADGSKMELGELPWPTTYDDDLNIVAVSAQDQDACNDAGFWSSRPGQHPFIDVGRLAWPTDGNGNPATEVTYDTTVGTFRTRNGHPLVHVPKAPSGTSFSSIETFSNSTSGALPATTTTPLEVGIVNEDCLCDLNVLFQVHYTFTINNLQLPTGASEMNLAFIGQAGTAGNNPSSWTFEQCPLSDIRNKIVSGSATLQASIAPKTGTTVSFWTSFATGVGETIQPQQYNFTSQIEVSWLGGLDCP